MKICHLHRGVGRSHWSVKTEAAQNHAARYAYLHRGPFLLTLAAAIVALFASKAIADDSSAGPSVAFSDAELVAGAAQAPNKDYRGGQISMQLMSEVNSIQPGQTFTLGLWIRHAPGWHTYWSNPGVVGVATAFVWDLPEGFSAAAVQWPAPQRTKMATLTAYGYEGDCVLLVDITAPDELPKDQKSVTLKTKLGWMACATSCHPGWSNFELTLPVATKESSDVNWNDEAHRLIEAERGRFAEAIDGWKYEAQRVTEAGEPDADGKWIELTARAVVELSQPRTLQQWGDVYFFSIDDQVDSDTPQVVRANEDGSVTLRMKESQYAPDNPANLSGVLYREQGWRADAHPWMSVEAKW